MSSDNNTKAHFIEVETGKMIAQLYIGSVPRVGEECRFRGEKYYRVDVVVHVYDEEVPVNRVNIGITHINPSSDK